MKKVILVGMCAPYPEDTDAEIWGVTFSYQRQKNLSRLYFFDPLDQMVAATPTFIEDVNALGIPVISTQRWEEIPLSEPFPLLEALALDENTYFASSACYAVAHALLEGVEHLTMYRFLENWAAADYLGQKPCLDEWCQRAKGKGIQVDITENSAVCSPWPWQPQLYGYAADPHSNTIGQIFSAQLRSMLIRRAS